MEQMEVALKGAEAKYSPRIFKHVWVFDHSSGHTAYGPDTLVTSVSTNDQEEFNQLCETLFDTEASDGGWNTQGSRDDHEGKRNPY